MADEPTVFVHRWTATEVHRRWADHGQHDQLADAHLRAAECWQWRVRVWPQDRQRELDNLLEARHHLLSVCRPDAAADLTEMVCSRLHAWGAWDGQEALIRGTLAHMPATSERRPIWLIWLGGIAKGRGRPGEAARRYGQGWPSASGWRLLQREPQRADLAEELGVALRLLAAISTEAAQRARILEEIIRVLTPFERGSTITPRGTALLAWARQ